MTLNEFKNLPKVKTLLEKEDYRKLALRAYTVGTMTKNSALRKYSNEMFKKAREKK